MIALSPPAASFSLSLINLVASEPNSLPPAMFQSQKGTMDWMMTAVWLAKVRDVILPVMSSKQRVESRDKWERGALWRVEL